MTDVVTIRMRFIGGQTHAEIDVLVDPNISVEVAVDVARAVVRRVRSLGNMSFVRVFTHPSGTEA